MNLMSVTSHWGQSDISYNDFKCELRHAGFNMWHLFLTALQK